MSVQDIYMHTNLSEIHRLDDDIVNELITNIRKVLDADDIDFTGNLSKSVKVENIDEIRYVLVDSPYATVVDKGMPPGKNVNFDALKNWVQGKLQITDENEANSVTIAIQKKILNKGIKPKFFAKKAIKMLVSKRGVPKIVANRKRQKIGRFERALNKAVKIMKKVNRFTKKLSRNINKVDKAIRYVRR